MGRKKLEKDKEKWWKKPPRSSRKCFRCGHLYSSHIDVRCLKIVQLKPERVECGCKGFVANEAEMEMIKDREERKRKRLAEEAENSFIEKEDDE